MMQSFSLGVSYNQSDLKWTGPMDKSLHENIKTMTTPNVSLSFSVKKYIL